MRYTPLVPFIFYAGCVGAYTLRETENQVLDKNYLNHSFVFRQQAAKDKLRSLKTDLLPDVTLSHTATNPYGQDELKPSQKTIFDVTLPLNKSVNYSINASAVNLDGKIDGQREIAVQSSLLQLVRTNYYELKALDEQQALHEANLQQLKKINAANSAELRGQLASARQSEELEEVYLRQQRAGYTLKNLLRIAPNEDLVLGDPLPQKFVFPFPFKMKFIPSDLMLAQYTVEKAKNNLLLLYTSEVPNFFATYQSISAHDESSTQKQFLFGVNWQLQPKAFFDVFAKKAEVLAVENEFDDKKEAVGRSVEDIISRLKTLQSRMNRQQKIIELQEKIVESGLAEFSRATSTTLSSKTFYDDVALLFEEKNRLLEQRFATVQAFADFARLTENNDIFYKSLGLSPSA